MLFKRLSTRVTLAILGAAVAVSGADTGIAGSRKSEDDAPPPSLQNFAGPARVAVVSLARQRVSFYDAQGNVVRSPISSGQASLDTPVGVYSVLQKEVEHTSNIYDDAQMPFMQRITWSGIALHAGALPGYPASHGCVRMPLTFAEQIFEKTGIGLRVVISRDDVAPVAIDHPMLFQPKPIKENATPVAERISFAEDPPMLPDVAQWPARRQLQERLKAVANEKDNAAKDAKEAAEPFAQPVKEKSVENTKAQKNLKSAQAQKMNAEQQLERAAKALASAKNARQTENAERARANAQSALEKADAKLNAVTAEADETASALAAVKAEFDKAEVDKSAAVAAAKEAERKILPVSVFISRKTQRLYVRQGHSPVMDVPVTIRDPDLPIGTHVFTALDYAPDGNSTRWNVVSIARYEDTIDEFRNAGKQRQNGNAAAGEPPPTDIAAATQALERITFAPEIKESLSEYVWPGTSIIISDEEMHKKETNNFTDFVVLVSGYPQGGIKKRRPPPVSPYYSDAPLAFFWSSPSPYRQQQMPRSRYRTKPVSPWNFW